MTVITAATAYIQAKNLVARAAELGIKKNGKDLTADQGAELLAAAVGFRNRHALLAADKEGLTHVDLKTTWDAFVADFGPTAALAEVWKFLGTTGAIQAFLEAPKLKQSVSVFTATAPLLADVLTDYGYSFKCYVNEGGEAPEDAEAMVSGVLAIAKDHIRKFTDKEISTMTADELLFNLEASLSVLTPSRAKARWKTEAPLYPKSEWEHAIATGSKLSYWHWVSAEVAHHEVLRSNAMLQAICRARPALDKDELATVKHAFENICTRTGCEQHRMAKYEGLFHKMISGKLSKRDQGHVMGAYREVIQATMYDLERLFLEKIKVDSAHSVQSPSVPLTVEHVQSLWPTVHPKFSMNDWRYELENQDTQLDYWDWVLGKVNSAMDDAVVMLRSELKASELFTLGEMDRIVHEAYSCSIQYGMDPATQPKAMAQLIMHLQGILSSVKIKALIQCYRDAFELANTVKPEVLVVDTATAATYRRSVWTMPDATLLQHAGIMGVKVASWHTVANIRAALMEAYMVKDQLAADEFFENYKFDGEVVDHEGWTVLEDVRQKVVFVVPEDKPELDSKKVVLTIQLRDHRVVEAIFTK